MSYLLEINPAVYIGAGTLFSGVAAFIIAVWFGNLQATAAKNQADVAARALGLNEQALLQTVKRDSFDQLQHQFDNLSVLVDRYEDEVKASRTETAIVKEANKQCEERSLAQQEEIMLLRERLAVIEEQVKGAH